MDKNKAVIDYLRTCPAIASSKLFFNFGEEEDKNKQIVTSAMDKVVEKPYIDGSVLKQYTFTIIDYRSVIYQALTTNLTNYPNENVDDMLDVQSVIDWIEQQDSNRNFPNFGSDCAIDSISALTDSPNVNGVDTNTSPALAKYSFAIRVEYLDKSKCIWNRTISV